MKTDVATQSIAEKLRLKLIPLTLVVSAFAFIGTTALLFLAARNQRVTVQGKLDIHHADDFTRGRSSNTNFLLTADGQRYLLKLEGPSTAMASGSTIKVTGTKSGSTISVSNLNNTQVFSAAAVTAVAGPKKVAVVLLNFQNDTSQPFSVNTVRSLVFTGTNSSNAYYQEVSANQLSLIGKDRTDGDIYEWVTVPYTNTSCEYTAWANAAKAIIGSATLTGYDYFVYAFPYTAACSWGGLAAPGLATSWVNGNVNSYYVGHELGHNFGTGHASTRSCTSGGSRVFLSTTCTNDEYGDVFDVMGNWNRHMSASRKGYFQWYVGANTLDVTDNGTFFIEPQETVSSGVKALRILRETGSAIPEYLYLEFRQRFGVFDNFSPSDPAVQGVAIRLGSGYDIPGAKTYLLDATPATTVVGDSPLAVGYSVTDPDNAVTITTNSVSTSGASVTVVFNCLHHNPLIQPPTTTPWMRPGTITYTLNALNNDRTACSPGQYYFLTNLPSGWTRQAIPNMTLTPHTPAPFNVIVNTGSLASGTYSVPIYIYSLSPSGYQGSTVLSYRIDRFTPTISISPSQNTNLPETGTVNVSAYASDGSSGVSQITIAIDNNDVYGCSTPTGLSTASCIYSWPMYGVTSGLHSIKATVTDVAGNIGSQSISVCYPYTSSGRPLPCAFEIQ